MKTLRCFLCAPLLCAALLCSGPLSAAERVNVILWFDTEDYLLPADDDACKRLAQMLTERHIRATFKIVGEKARVLEQRGRRDVISALKKHDIAYHANFHSLHPTPSEYLADCGLLDGAAEFIRREGSGAADVRRIFSVQTLACYGQPGSSWAPQAIIALPQIGVAPHGVPCYVDEGDHVGLNEQPFWFAGVLNVYHMGRNCTRMELHDPAALEPAKQRFSAVARRLLGQDRPGLISIYYHPCEWVHREFWDGVNFRRGANPPREQWKIPPQRTAEETDAAFRRFGEYMDFIRAIPQVRFVVASDLPLIYADAVRSTGASEDDLAEIASAIARPAGTSPVGTDALGTPPPASSSLDFRVLNDRAYSLADQFELLTTVVGNLLDGRKPRFSLKATGLLGPDNAPPPPAALERLDWPAFRDATCDVLSFIQTERRIPSRVFIGADAIPPNQFLGALAQVYLFYRAHGTLPTSEGVFVPAAGELLPACHIAQDSPGLFGGWVIHKENFRAPKLLELARLQAWTLKPALARREK